MANKTLRTRQKLVFRLEPARNPLKPRNPFALAAGQRTAGTHRRTASALRHMQKRNLKKSIGENGDD